MGSICTEENWKDSRSISIQKLLPRRGGTCAGAKEGLARRVREGSLKQPGQDQQRLPGKGIHRVREADIHCSKLGWGGGGMPG